MLRYCTNEKSFFGGFSHHNLELDEKMSEEKLKIQRYVLAKVFWL